MTIGGRWQRQTNKRYNRPNHMGLYTRRRLVTSCMCVVLLAVSIIGSRGTKANEAVVVTYGSRTQAALYGCDWIVDTVGVYPYPFNAMSQDWSAEDVAGFWYHDISIESKAVGGYFPPIAQVYTYIVCKSYGVDYEMIFALIEHESKFRYDAESAGGTAVGYMQVRQEWADGRVERLGVTDMKNPYQNILIGVAYIAELQETIARSGTQTLQADVLAAYDMGLENACRTLWANGIHEYAYNRAIMDRANELRREKPEGR